MSSNERDADAAREAAFLEACLAKGQTPKGALAIYRRLIRTNIGNVVFRLMPETRAKMNATYADAFDTTLVDFMHDVGPRSHHLRDVPAEFFAFAEPRWRAAGIDRATLDLARREIASFAVETAPNDAERALQEIDLDRGVAISRSVHVERFEHGDLLFYRSAENDVIDIEIEPFFAAIVMSLQKGDTLREAMGEAAKRENVALDAGVLARVATFLADLGERGAILGGA